MKYISLFTFSLSLMMLAFTACNKHEVIPSPSETVNLKCQFEATIDSTEVSFTKNVWDYKCIPSSIITTNSSPQLSEAVYFTKLGSVSKISSIQIGFGSVKWDGSLSSTPTSNAFKAFFNGELTPAYSTDGKAGFEVIYTDEAGKIWKSDANTGIQQSVTFTDFNHITDKEGDYVTFVATFDCSVFHNDGQQTDTLRIMNARYKSWFKR